MSRRRGPTGGSGTGSGGSGGGSGASKAAEELQKVINYLNAAYRTGAGSIGVDGKYGPRTAGAFSALIAAIPQLGSELEKVGVGGKLISSHKLMRQSPDKLQAANDRLQKLAARVKAAGGGASGAGGKAKGTTPKSVGAMYDLERKRNLSDNEILYYLDNKTAVHPLTGEKATLMGHIRANTRKFPGKTRDTSLGRMGASAVKLIRKLYGKSAPIEWDNGQFTRLFDTLKGGSYGSLVG